MCSFVLFVIKYSQELEGLQYLRSSTKGSGRMRVTTHGMKDAMLHGSATERLITSYSLLTTLEENLPWLAARTFDGINITRKEDGYLVVLKGHRGKQSQVAFFTGCDVADAIMVMTHELLFDLAKWRPDKWAAMRSDKS